jgi:hypothetical protein
MSNTKGMWWQRCKIHTYEFSCKHSGGCKFEGFGGNVVDEETIVVDEGSNGS